MMFLSELTTVEDLEPPMLPLFDNGSTIVENLELPVLPLYELNASPDMTLETQNNEVSV
jgi:hypothetical protein